MVDADSMTVTSTLKVDTKAAHPTWHIRFVTNSNRLFVVASRYYQYVDVLEVEGNNLTTDLANQTAIDVTDGYGTRIYTLVEHPGSGNSVLMAGHGFNLKTISIEAY